MRAILPLAAILVGLAACDSPTAPSLNPQPLPPGRHFSSTTGSVPGKPGATIQACGIVRSGTYEPPDPCLR